MNTILPNLVTWRSTKTPILKMTVVENLWCHLKAKKHIQKRLETKLQDIQKCYIIQRITHNPNTVSKLFLTGNKGVGFQPYIQGTYQYHQFLTICILTQVGSLNMWTCKQRCSYPNQVDGSNPQLNLLQTGIRGDKSNSNLFRIKMQSMNTVRI